MSAALQEVTYRSFCQDGLDYYFREEGAVVYVSDCNFENIGSATYHSTFEDVTYEYRDHEGCIVGEGSCADLYNYSHETLARWIAATHPIGG